MNWLKGLAAAALSGAASMLGAMVLDPDHFNTGNLKHLGLVAGLGALTGTVGYLKQSPLPNGTIAPTQAIDPKRFTGVAVLLALCLGFMACANVTAKLPHRPDGSVDVQVLLGWAQDGIAADCALLPGSTVCTIGTDVIKVATTKGDPASVKQSLVDGAAQWPVIDPYVRWLINAL